MGIEDSVMKILHRLDPRPTMRDAREIVQVGEVQEEALWIADTMRYAAIEENVRLQRLYEGGGERPPLNYRGFLVGGLGIGLYPEKKQAGVFGWFAFAAWNTRHYPKGHPEDVGKTCCETRIGNRFLARKCSCLLCLAVVGELNEGGDGRSGKHGPGPTIDPCEVCRDNMRDEYLGLYQHGTTILTAQPGLKVRAKPRSVQELMDTHDEVWWQPGDAVVSIKRGG